MMSVSPAQTQREPTPWWHSQKAKKRLKCSKSKCLGGILKRPCKHQSYMQQAQPVTQSVPHNANALKERESQEIMNNAEDCIQRKPSEFHSPELLALPPGGISRSASHACLLPARATKLQFGQRTEGI
eukprot:1156876-Pelagomonas_calceolata.AAC.14